MCVRERAGGGTSKQTKRALWEMMQGGRAGVCGGKTKRWQQRTHENLLVALLVQQRDRRRRHLFFVCVCE